MLGPIQPLREIVIQSRGITVPVRIRGLLAPRDRHLLQDKQRRGLTQALLQPEIRVPRRMPAALRRGAVLREGMTKFVAELKSHLGPPSILARQADSDPPAPV